MALSRAARCTLVRIPCRLLTRPLCSGCEAPFSLMPAGPIPLGLPPQLESLLGKYPSGDPAWFSGLLLFFLVTCSVLYGLWRQLIFAACDGYRSCPVACLFSPSVMFFDEYKFLISVWCCFRIVSFRVAIFESCVVDLSLSRGRQIPSGLTFLSILPFPLQSSEHLNGVSIPRLPMLCSVGFCWLAPVY